MKQLSVRERNGRQAVTRRGVLLGAAAAGVLGSGLAPGLLAADTRGAASDTAGAPALNQARKTYVLVHGTWHGGWCWHWVAQRLRAAGHRVIAPTATGCGERYHLIEPETGLSTHIDDVIHAIEWEELDDVILVGHSFAGTTITGVADRIPERTRRIVFFDALIPTRERPAAINPDPVTGDWPDWWKERMTSFIDGYKMIFWDHYEAKMLVPEDAQELIALLRRRLTWHPMRQWTEPLKLVNGGWAAHPRTLIHAVGQVYSPSSEAMVGPARAPGWQFIELDVARDSMLTHPDRLAECLLSLD